MAKEASEGNRTEGHSLKEGTFAAWSSNSVTRSQPDGANLQGESLTASEITGGELAFVGYTREVINSPWGGPTSPMGVAASQMGVAASQMGVPMGTFSFISPVGFGLDLVLIATVLLYLSKLVLGAKASSHGVALSYGRVRSR